jgi:hypothetical protein
MPQAGFTERFINLIVVTLLGEWKMPSIIMENEDVQTESLRTSKEFLDYLNEAGITPAGHDYGFPNYRVASGLPRENASSRLCYIAGEMEWTFDVDPTPVVSRGNSRMEFANQIGIFYIDGIISE